MEVANNTGNKKQELAISIYIPGIQDEIERLKKNSDVGYRNI